MYHHRKTVCANPNGAAAVDQNNETPEDLLSRVQALLPSLSRAEAKIARKLLAEPKGFIRSSVRGIAADIGVSEPTVVRFCRTIGCDGFWFGGKLRQSGAGDAQSLVSAGYRLHVLHRQLCPANECGDP